MNSIKPLSLRPKNILVIVMPYLGDVLLATPLLHSLKLAYPQAKLDVLVFDNTKAILEGNADLHQIITVPNRPTFWEKLQIFFKIFRRYDLAMATQTGDRPFFYTLFASSTRVNAVPPRSAKAWWKRLFAQRWIEFDNDNTHTVLQNLKLLESIDIPKFFRLVAPQVDESKYLNTKFSFLTDKTPFVVLHLCPRHIYKRWTVEGWIEIGAYLAGLGFTLVVSGGGGTEETAYLDAIVHALPKNTFNIAGQVSIAELAYIISHAQLFIGPDTGMTHLAAATDIPVIALFGPTNLVKWAPWPCHYHLNTNPFHKIGTQRVNNVYLIQGEAEMNCVPCHLEGCDRHRESKSKCLDTLKVERVKEAVAVMLNLGK